MMELAKITQYNRNNVQEYWRYVGRKTIRVTQDRRRKEIEIKINDHTLKENVEIVFSERDMETVDELIEVLHYFRTGKRKLVN